MEDPIEYTLQLKEGIRKELQKQKNLLMSLFKFGRTVQPTDTVLRLLGPKVLLHPTDPRDMALLGEILDPNRTNFVVLKRVQDLVQVSTDQEEHDSFSSLDDEEEEEDEQSREQVQIVPPKRLPPSSPPSPFSTTTTALTTLRKQTQHEDPDKVVIMMALNWSGKHLSQTFAVPPVKLPPLSRFIVPVSQTCIPNEFQRIDLSALFVVLNTVYDDRERGKLCLALVASYFLSEVAFRDSVLDPNNFVQDIVPEQLLKGFMLTHRIHRVQVLEEKSHELLQRLSAVRLPLVVTTLKVELESSLRNVSNHVLGFSHAGRQVCLCWLSLSERQRSAFVTFMFELNVFSSDMWALLEAGEEGDSRLLDVILLPLVLELENHHQEEEEEKKLDELSIQLDHYRQEIDSIYKHDEDLAVKENLHQEKEEEEEEELDTEIRSLQVLVAALCAEVWL